MDARTQFMKALLRPTMDIVRPVPIVPFANWDYYYITEELSWQPSEGHSAEYNAVTAPVGFVTDLASIPQPFWSLLPPAGPYGYAAIIHDYLYWFQPQAKTGSDSRAYADSILKIAMDELGVSLLKSGPIYEAVRVAGGRAWRSNAEAAASGERRVLKRFPTDPRTSWKQWKMQPDVFV
jgi:Protein of unknown function (DUF1353)